MGDNPNHKGEVMSWLLKIDKALAGAPDQILTALLLGLAAVSLIVAFVGKPALKAAVAAWFLFP